MPTTRIFKNGNSQAVRLPKDCRFGPEVREVELSRDGASIVLTPVQPKAWPKEFWQAFEGKPMPAGFERPKQVRQRRKTLSS